MKALLFGSSLFLFVSLSAQAGPWLPGSGASLEGFTPSPIHASRSGVTMRDLSSDGKTVRASHPGSVHVFRQSVKKFSVKRIPR